MEGWHQRWGEAILCLLYTRAHPGNGHEASSHFLFYILTIMCSVSLGKSPGLSVYLCMLKTGPALVIVGEFLLCACLEQHGHIVCGQY